MKSYINDEFFSRLEALSYTMRKNMNGYFGGKHRVKSYGQTVDFADYREYQLGDDIRRIDWNLFARLEKYFIKLFNDERQMHVQIFLDCSASMGMDPQKAAYATALAAGIGFIAIKNMDKVSFNFVHGNRSENPFGILVGKRAFLQAVSGLDKIKFEGEANLAEAIPNTPTTGRNDGLTVIISDFFTENDWHNAVDFLCFMKRQVMLIQVLTMAEIDPLSVGRYDLIDSESIEVEDARNIKVRVTRSLQSAYEDALNEIIKEIRDFCISRDVDFISVNTDTQIEHMIFRDFLRADMKVI